MDARQYGLTVIEVVAALAQLEIEDIDAEHLLHLLVGHAAAHVLSDGLCHAEEHALKVVDLAGLLYLHQDDLTA